MCPKPVLLLHRKVIPENSFCKILKLKKQIMSNTVSKIGQDSLGIKLGDKIFQAFLLAGERNIVSGLKRKGTYEEAFANFFKNIPKTKQNLLKGYFTKQNTLIPTERVKLLGGLTSLDLSTPLILRSFAPKLLLKYHSKKTKSNKQDEIRNCKEDLILKLEQIKVVEAQDDYWFFGSKNTTDEVGFQIISIDATGDIAEKFIRVGSIKEGRSKFDKQLAKFNVCKSKNEFPKKYQVIIYPVELDDNGFNDLVKAFFGTIKNRINEELIKFGLNAIGGALVLNNRQSEIIGSLLKQLFDSFLNWITRLLTNNDDLMGVGTATARLSRFNATWSNGNRKSNVFEWDFERSNGHWQTKMYWELN